MKYLSKNLPPELAAKIASKIDKAKANKSLGQHFLTDVQICDEIVLSCKNLNNKTVVEVGPGLGSLSQAILALNNKVNLISIEKDTRFIDILEDISDYYEKRFHIINDDALQFDFSKIDGDFHIVANLPYNIGTELLFKWLQPETLKKIKSINVMLQKEVANRITAKNNSSNYSWLGIISQLFCDCSVVFNIPPTAFSPLPKVWSSFISLKPYDTPLYEHNFKQLEKICKTFFKYRRKMISSIIKKHLNFSVENLEKMAINQQSRPENITLEQFCALSLIK